MRLEVDEDTEEEVGLRLFDAAAEEDDVTTVFLDINDDDEDTGGRDDEEVEDDFTKDVDLNVDVVDGTIFFFIIEGGGTVPLFDNIF